MRITDTAVNMKLLIDLLERLSIIAILAYFFSRFKPFRHVLLRSGSVREKTVLAVLFGLLAVAGTYTGIPVQGALANSRVVGAAVAGLLGGPWVGLAAGLMGGLHRYALGGFTALACGVSTTAEGLFAGLVNRAARGKTTNWLVGFWTGFAAESLQMLIILAVARPFNQAWELVQVIGVPMIVANSLGVGVFMATVRALKLREDRIGALQTQKVLDIANQTLPHLRKGLDFDSAAAAARIIYEATDADAVALTDRGRILAHVGVGSDHHRPGEPILTEATKQVLSEGKIVVAETRGEIGCKSARCQLGSAIVVPLRCREEIIGALKFYRIQENAITSLEQEFITGIAQLFATQFELAALQRQAELVTRAELKALRAQINPHFLFNALNTIVSYVRTEPETARRLLIYLGDFFRRNLHQAGDFVTLAEELNHVKAYLAIEQARFGEKLQFREEIDPSLSTLELPVLTLQPLVENAVKHGLLPKQTGGTVSIRVAKVKRGVRITVHDDGVGIPPDRIVRLLAPDSSGTDWTTGVGLSNVHERLKSIYGQSAGLRMESEDGRGTTVEFVIPRRLSAARPGPETRPASETPRETREKVAR